MTSKESSIQPKEAARRDRREDGGAERYQPKRSIFAGYLNVFPRSKQTPAVNFRSGRGYPPFRGRSAIGLI